MNIKEKIQLLDRLIVSYEQQYKDELEYNPGNSDYPTDEEAKPRTADKCYGLRFLTALRKVSILLTIRAEGTPANTRDELILLAQAENITMPNEALTEDAINVLAESVAGLSLTPFGRLEGFREGFTTIEAPVINQSRGISRIHSLAIVGDIVLLGDIGGIGGSRMDITKASTGAVVRQHASSSTASSVAVCGLSDTTATAVGTSSSSAGLVMPCIDDCESVSAVFTINEGPQARAVPKQMQLNIGISPGGRYQRSVDFAKLLMSMITQELTVSPLPESPQENPRFLRLEIETTLTRMVATELDRLSRIDFLLSGSIRIGSTDNSPNFSLYEGLDAWTAQINTHRNTYNTDFIAQLDPSKVSALEELIASILVRDQACSSKEEIENQYTSTDAGEYDADDFVDTFIEPLRNFCRQNFPALNTDDTFFGDLFDEKADDWFSGLIQFPSNFLAATCHDLLDDFNGKLPVDDFSSSFCAKVFVAALTGFDDQHRLSAAPQSGIQPPSSPSVRVSVANTPQLFSIREGGFEENKSEDADSAIVDSPPNTSSSSR